jgi:deoxyhypusine synthase
MTKMMIDMGIKPSGNVDRDFVSMMVPHHQGAIEMAQAQLRYGHNEQLKRLAQEIIVTQQQEIAAMRLAVGQPMAPSVLSPNQASDIQQMGSAYTRHTGIVQEP